MLSWLYGVDKSKKQEEKSNLPAAQKGLDALKSIKQEKLLHLVIDGDLIKNWVAYEQREPGCIKALFNGFAFVLSDLERKDLNPEYIRSIHKLCTTDVEGIPTQAIAQLRVKEMDFETDFILEPATVTLQGLAEKTNHANTHGGSFYLLDKFDELKLNTKEMDPEKLKEMLELISARECFFRALHGGDRFDKEFKSIIDYYNTTIKTAKTEDEKLEVIIKTIYEFEHLHPFIDANIRTFVILLLNRLLIQNGFIPAVFKNPNCFDGYSKKELLVLVKQGMKNTEDLIKGADLFGFDSSKIPAKYQMEYSKMVQNFVDTLQKTALPAKKTYQENNSSVNQIPF